MKTANAWSYLQAIVLVEKLEPEPHISIHDGYTKALRRPHDVVWPSGSFVFHSYGLREINMARCQRWSHEVHTKVTRCDKMATRWSYECRDGHTKSTRCWPFARPSDIFLARQRFFNHSRSCSRCLRNAAEGHTMAQDGYTNSPMATRSVPKLNISTIVCPSGHTIGTVWRQHYRWNRGSCSPVWYTHNYLPCHPRE